MCECVCNPWQPDFTWICKKETPIDQARPTITQKSSKRIQPTTTHYNHSHTIKERSAQTHTLYHPLKTPLDEVGREEANRVWVTGRAAATVRGNFDRKADARENMMIRNELLLDANKVPTLLRLQQPTTSAAAASSGGRWIALAYVRRHLQSRSWGTQRLALFSLVHGPWP